MASRNFSSHSSTASAVKDYTDSPNAPQWGQPVRTSRLPSFPGAYWTPVRRKLRPTLSACASLQVSAKFCLNIASRLLETVQTTPVSLPLGQVAVVSRYASLSTFFIVEDTTFIVEDTTAPARLPPASCLASRVFAIMGRGHRRISSEISILLSARNLTIRSVLSSTP